MALPTYATREDVKSALDVKETARNNAQVDRALQGASRSVEAKTKRRFYPELATRYFPWPDRNSPTPWRLWLDEHEVVSITTLTSAGVALAPTDYFLEPQASGPPYDRVEVNRTATATFNTGSTPQQNIAITGVFGYRLDTAPAGTAAEAMDSSETGLDVSDGSLLGVGDLLAIDSERMIVTERSMLTTGLTLGGAGLTASTSDVSVTASGAGINQGETIMIDAEKMRVVEVAGSVLVVKRAWDGSALAVHTAGATIFSPRTLTVARGALGTTAATHSISAPILRHTYPALVTQICLAEAVSDLLQETAGWARVAGSGDNEREVAARGLADLRKRLCADVGRGSRNWAV